MAAGLLTTALAAKTLASSDGSPRREKSSSFKEAFLNRPITWIIIAGGVGFLLYKAGKSWSSSVKEWLKGRDYEKEYKQKEQIMKLSYSPTQYKALADSMYSAFVGTAIDPTDEDRIASVMSQMKNDLDVLELIKVYGKRDVGFIDPEATMIEQLNSELSDSDKEKYVNSILRRNKINYQF